MILWNTKLLAHTTHQSNRASSGSFCSAHKEEEDIDLPTTIVAEFTHFNSTYDWFHKNVPFFPDELHLLSWHKAILVWLAEVTIANM